MNSKELGRTRQEVPELAQGLWKYRGSIDPLRVGIELGASFIDTAEEYCNEELVGEAIQGARDRVFLASKVSPGHFRYKDVIKAAEFSLKRLKTDHLDLYQLHKPNYKVPIAETMSAMERLVETGKVRLIGVSNFSVRELARAQSCLSKERIVSNQVRYSLVDRSAELDLLPYCEANQISLLAWSPLANGLDSLLKADRADVLGRVANALGKTRAQVALNWCISHPAVIAIFKTENVEHVRENAAASGWSLTPEQRQMLSEGVSPFLTRSRPEQFARRVVKRVLQHTIGWSLEAEGFDRDSL